MLKTTILCVLLLTLSDRAVGQQQALPPDFAAQMAKDLAAVYGSETVPPSGLTGWGAQPLVVTSDAAALHAGAGETTELREQVGTGTVLTAYTQAGDWFGVQAPGGITGWVNSEYVAPLGMVKGENMAVGGVDVSAWMEQRIQEMLVRSGQFRDAYKNNPYVSVDGFSVTVGLPPGLDVNFSFK